MPLNAELSNLCCEFEWAQARQSLAFAQAWHRTRGLPCAQGEFSWGACVFVEPGHFLNQGLALGLASPCDDKALDALEQRLEQGGHPVVLELSPGADPGLPGLLAARGYRIRAFQQVWHRSVQLPVELPIPANTHLQADPEPGLWAQVVMAGFQDRDVLDPGETAAFIDTLGAAGNQGFLAFVNGEAAGAATLGFQGEVAVLSGTSVLPRFRGRGLQKALIAARLASARQQGCPRACSASLPGTASQASLEGAGFRVAYPKLELVRS